MGESLRDQLRRDLEALTNEMKSLSPSSIRDGNWLANFLTNLLSKRDFEETRDRLGRELPGLKPRAAAQKLIKRSARNAGIVGSLAGGLVGATTLLSFLTMGGSLAAGALTVLAELAIILRLQVHLAYDVATLHGVRLEKEPPLEILLILSAIHGGKTGAASLTRRHLARQTPAFAFQLARQLGIGMVQRNAVKFALPVACIAICSGLNYYKTKRLGSLAAEYFEREGEIESLLYRQLPPDHDAERLILPLVFAMASADGKVEDRESQVFRTCLETLRSTLDPDEWRDIDRLLLASREELIAEVAAVADQQMRRAILDILDLTMRIDGEIHPEETRLFAQVAAAFRGEDPFEPDEFGDLDADDDAD